MLSPLALPIPSTSEQCHAAILEVFERATLSAYGGLSVTRCTLALQGGAGVMWKPGTHEPLPTESSAGGEGQNGHRQVEGRG
jgi:hypothetical protein